MSQSKLFDIVIRAHHLIHLFAPRCLPLQLLHKLVQHYFEFLNMFFVSSVVECSWIHKTFLMQWISFTFPISLIAMWEHILMSKRLLPWVLLLHPSSVFLLTSLCTSIKAFSPITYYAIKFQIISQSFFRIYIMQKLNFWGTFWAVQLATNNINYFIKYTSVKE